jgi:hypothetical protein
MRFNKLSLSFNLPILRGELTMRSLTRASLAFLTIFALTATASVAQPVRWGTLANNGDIAPGGDPTATFRSYSQPSINDAQQVVFRARSRPDGGGAQVDGVYSRDFSAPGSIVKLLTRDDPVPAPNNTDYQGLPAAFTEFPSIPRIDPTSSLIATRGSHQPVWTYLLGITETRVGTSGIYAFPFDSAVTGASLLGSVVEPDQVTLSFPQYSVPGATPGTRFDQFPGSPAEFDGKGIAFKGNYTEPADGLGRTGIYYRDVVSDPPRYTGLIADSNMLIPNQPAGGMVPFGSTAPPSAANGWVYFVGLDIEDAPTLGGIYRAHVSINSPILQPPQLHVLVGIGEQVPGEDPGIGFHTFGEGLSVSSDGSQVAFWASWGTETFQKTLSCPTDGNADLIAYCNAQYPAGLVVDIPVNQGIFIYDTASAQTIRLARTGEDGLQDLLFWVFSGMPPGVGGGDEGSEPPRWRSSAFAALSVVAGQPAQVAFKAQRNGAVGIYAREVFQPALVTIAEVGTTPGTAIDPMAPAGSLVTALGIEREGFRNGILAITASMTYVDPQDPEVSVGWAGVYAGPTSLDLIFHDGFDG